MAIPKTVTETATTAKPGINAAAIARLVDELGQVDRKLAPYRLAIRREEELRKAIRAEFDASPAAAGFEAAGDLYIVQVGPRALTRSWSPAKLIKAIGLKAYAAIAKVTLGDLEANVSAEIRAGLITAEHTGARSLKLFEREAKAA